MRQELAEGFLGRVMNWERARLAEEQPLLDRMARFKYDEYQHFAPGRKFVENLGLWLNQFKSLAEREVAYAFVKSRLVFVSGAEMRHLVEAAFPDVIRPLLIRRAAKELGLPAHSLSQVMSSSVYQRTQRASLFLGLSDGAHMDVFRRSAALDNEQVWQAYELSRTKSAGMLSDLRAQVGDAGVFFERVVLVDDFSASGRSYIRREEDGTWKGKIVKAIRQFDSPEGEALTLVAPAGNEMFIVLCLATIGAVTYIRERLLEFFADRPGPTPTVLTVYELPASTALSDQMESDRAFLALVDSDLYYRTRGLDPHEAKGGTESMKRGFADCALPVVLAHNCPNNGVFLLWADGQEAGSAHGLFPRVVRHKDTS